MKYLIDEDLPYTAAALATSGGVSAIHVIDVGLNEAEDEAVVAYALAERLVIVTLDGDYHRILAVGRMVAPSIIRSRIEGMKGPAVAALIRRIDAEFSAVLAGGVAMTVDEHQVRWRSLPLV
jgi:predicted nuclease of predicted toxin-antitoxin system